MMTKEINWAAPALNSLVIGRKYIDREGLIVERNDVFWGWSTGQYLGKDDVRHVRDLIAEYTPPAPRKMWMNECNGVDGVEIYPTEAWARNVARGLSAIRIAVPVSVTITEGH